VGKGQFATFPGQPCVNGGRKTSYLIFRAIYANAANSLFKIFPVGLTGIDGTITMRDGRL
jgi:hypothetical protein